MDAATDGDPAKLTKSDLIAEIDRLKNRVQELESTAGPDVSVERDSWLGSLLDAAPVGSSIARDSGLLEYVNDSFAEILGMSHEELLRTNARDLYWDIEDRSAAFARVRKDGYVRDLETAFRRSDGSKVWALLSLQPTSYKGSPAIFGWIHDITERKRAELALQANQERFELAVKGAGEGIWDWDAETDRVHVSPRCLEILGRDTDVSEIGPKEWFDRLHPDDFEPYQKDMAALLRGKSKILVTEFRIRRPDGTYRWAQARGLGLRNGGDKVLRLTGTLTDIDERKATERALMESEERLLSVLSQSPIGVSIRYEDDRTLAYTNRRMDELFGYPSGAQNAQSGSINFFDTDAQKKFAEHLARDGRIEDMEMEARRADGTRFWCLLSIYRVNYQGRPARLGWFYDITGRKKAENRFKSLLESAPDATVIVNADGEIIRSNRQTEVLFGFSADELDGQKIEILIPDRLRDSHSAHRSAFVRHAETRPMGVGLELFGQKKDGSEFPIEISLSPIETDEGTLVSASVRDITERKDTERRLRESERQLSSILENSPIGVAIGRKSDGAVAFANKRMGDLFGMTLEEYLAAPIEAFYADPADYHDLIARLQKDGIVTGAEVRQKRKDGSTFWCSISLVPVTFSSEFRWIAWIEDITERKTAEDAVRESEARVRSMLESSPVGISIVSHATEKRLYANPGFNEMFTGDPEKSMEHFDVSASHVDLDTLAGINKDLAAHGFTYDAELPRRRTDGSIIWVLHSWRPARIWGENAFICWHTDITERKAAETALQQTKDQAEAALADLQRAQERLVITEKMASLGQLTAGIAHEIKNPLNFVNNFSETSVELLDELKEALEPVQDGWKQDTREEVDDILETLDGDLKKINHHGKRADGIVKSMLLHARGDASERLPTSINGLVQEALNLTYHGERARDKSFQVTMDTDFSRDGDAADVVPQEITRVLVNLFSNAFYAVKKRSAAAGSDDYIPRVAVSTQNTGEDIMIRIRDNGTGMPEEVREKLFDPFFTTKPTGEGTGLGLSMSFDIVVHQHGGQIDVDSEPGEFTEFAIRLPVRLENSGAGAT